MTYESSRYFHHDLNITLLTLIKHHASLYLVHTFQYQQQFYWHISVSGLDTKQNNKQILLSQHGFLNAIMCMHDNKNFII